MLSFSLNMNKIFNPKTIAIVGASAKPGKVGNVLLRNLKEAKNFKLFPINPHEKKILGLKCYPTVKDVSSAIDLAIIAVPADVVLNVVNDCAEKGIKHCIIITSGFSEIGNTRLENKLKKLLIKNNINAVGVNCLGIYDAHSKLDSIFIPKERMHRPSKGSVAFLCQSGAIGAAILDLLAMQNYGVSKFISYGNATVLDESDYLRYLANDPKTKIICFYLEAVKDGKKFIKVVKKLTKKKPIIALKGGITEEGARATLSHTGSLAGSPKVYEGVFRQFNIIQADSLKEMFNIARILDKCPKPKGNKIQIITNGGGYGILTTDCIVKNSLKLAKPTKSTKERLIKKFPKNVIVANPIDLLGDADDMRYKLALDTCIEDKNIDIIVLIILPQTPLLTKNLVSVFKEAKQKSDKPIIAILTGGNYTQEIKKAIEQQAQIPCFDFPEEAIISLKKVLLYYNLI